MVIEVLPAVTSHHVKAAADFLQLLGVCKIEFQGLVATQLSVLLPCTSTIFNLIVVRCLTVLFGNIPTTCGRDIETKVQVCAETVEELKLIVKLGITYETAYVRVLVLLVQLSHGVQRRHGVRSTIGLPAEVVAILIIDRLQGVKLNSRTNGAFVSIGVMGKYTLTIQINGQTVVEQCRSQVEAYCSSTHARSLQVTIVVQKTCTDTVRHLEGVLLRNITTSDAGVDFLSKSILINLILPFGACVTQSSNSIGIVAVVGHEELAECISTQHVNLLGNGLECTAHVNIDTRLGTCLTLLSGNQNHTV